MTSLDVMATIIVVMVRNRPYALGFAYAVAGHLRAIDAKHHSLIREKIEATWEVRFGPDNRFRVLYDIDEEARLVQVLAVGEKRRERLFIGVEEVQP